MLLAYVDESYTRDVYFVASLLCPGGQVKSLTEALDAVVAKASSNYGTAIDAELHGHDIFQGTRDWRKLKSMVSARIGVYGDALAAIGDHDVKIIIRGVDSRRLRERYTTSDDPHAIVLGQLLEQVDSYATRVGEFVLVINDEIGSSGQYRANLSYYRKYGLWGTEKRVFTRIVDTLHFAPSADSRLIQAVDLVVFLHRRMETMADSDLRAIRANSALWANIGRRIQHSRFWRP